MRINIQGLTANSGDVISDKLTLPSGIVPSGTQDLHILMPAMAANWIPTDQIIYVLFQSSLGATCRVRAINNETMDNIVLQGIYSFPRDTFTIN